MSALNKQVGGNHYKRMAIQPIEFIIKNGLSFCEGNIVKYICRYKYKNGLEDLKKILQYCEIIREFKTVGRGLYRICSSKFSKANNLSIEQGIVVSMISEPLDISLNERLSNIESVVIKLMKEYEK